MTCEYIHDSFNYDYDYRYVETDPKYLLYICKLLISHNSTIHVNIGINYHHIKDTENIKNIENNRNTENNRNIKGFSLIGLLNYLFVPIISKNTYIENLRSKILILKKLMKICNLEIKGNIIYNKQYTNQLNEVIDVLKFTPPLKLGKLSYKSEQYKNVEKSFGTNRNINDQVNINSKNEINLNKNLKKYLYVKDKLRNYYLKHKGKYKKDSLLNSFKPLHYTM